jgi:hypothetical protein
MKNEKWYQRRLAKYFTEHYEQYEDSAEYFPDPFVNQWLFDIRELGIRVELTCTDKGEVKEQRYKMKDYAEYVCKKLQSEVQGLDAIYEDYIIRVIGEEGFELLREKKYLNTCGSIGGRNLYTLL